MFSNRIHFNLTFLLSFHTNFSFPHIMAFMASPEVSQALVAVGASTDAVGASAVDKPLYYENVEGMAFVTINGNTYSFVHLEDLHYSKIKCVFSKKIRHCIYIYEDDVGGYPYYVNTKQEAINICLSYNSFKKEQELMIAEKKRKEAAEEEERRRKPSFPIKGNAAPTNPWKKVSN